MSKQKQHYVFADGNNGGDYVKIIDLEDGTVILESGSCCVNSISAIVPVEFLSAILSKTMMEHNQDIESVIDSFEWSKEFKAELKAKVKEVGAEDNDNSMYI